MTGEQKPGGLAQKIYDCPTTFDGDAIGTHLGLSMMVDQSTSTVEEQRRVVMSICEDIARMIQAEPAEARIRELEAETQIEKSAVRAMASQLRARATAALAHPLVQGSESGPTCQRCGGEIHGWCCQSCDAEFRENDAGNLVFDEDAALSQPGPASEGDEA